MMDYTRNDFAKISLSWQMGKISQLIQQAVIRAIKTKVL
jgi:hypothetical protein